MANEKRVRANAVGGAVDDNPLLIGATTLTSAALAALPVIDTTNYAALTIDPDGFEGSPEIVYVTAHASGATTATIVRAQESTVAIQHSVDIPWVNAPTTKDFISTYPDSPWAGDTLSGGPFDEEFERENAPTTLPTGLSWVNQGAATYVEEYGAGHIVGTGQGGDQYRMAVKTVPAVTAWTVTAKLGIAIGPQNFGRAGLILRESSTGKFYDFNVTNAGVVGLDHWSAVTATVGNDFNETYRVSPIYFRVAKASATSWTYRYSSDGITWRTLAAAFNPTYCTIDQVGFGTNVNNATSGTNPNEVSCHWMRFR